MFAISFYACNLVFLLFLFALYKKPSFLYRHYVICCAISYAIAFLDWYLCIYFWFFGSFNIQCFVDLYNIIWVICWTLNAIIRQMVHDAIHMSFEAKVCWFLFIILYLIAKFIYEYSKVELVRASCRLTANFAPESMKPGSNFELNARLPPFQVEIYGSTGDKFYPLGQGCNTAHGIITAAHVIYDVDRVAISRNGTQVVVRRDDFEFKDGDLATYKITQQQESQLGLSRAKLSQQSILGTTGLMAQVVAFGNRSFGFLSSYPQFGFCVYGGSTIKGFSGAPYYMNNTIFGIHIGGNGDNLGYESGYIHSILNPSRTVVAHAESSEDWLIEQAQRTNDFHYERSPYDPDEYRVRLNGRYHIVDGSVLGLMTKASKVKGKKKQTFAMDLESKPIPEAAVKPPSEVVYRPPKEEELPKMPKGAVEFQDQGNLFRAPVVSAGANGVQQKFQQSAQLPVPPTSVTTGCCCQMPLAKSHMESLTLTPVPQRKVSQSMHASRNRRNKLHLQRLRNDAQLWREHVARTQGGPQISPVRE